MASPPIVNIPVARAVGTVEVDGQERHNLYLTFQSVGMKLHPVVSPAFAQILSNQQMAVFLNRPGKSRALMLIRANKPPVFFFTKDPLVRHLKAVPR